MRRGYRAGLLGLLYLAAAGGLTALAVRQVRAPVPLPGAVSTRPLTPGGPHFSTAYDSTYYGFPLPVEEWAGVTPQAGVTTWTKAASNPAVAACLVLAAWALPLAAWRTGWAAIGARPEWPAGLRALFWGTLAAACGGIAAAAAATLVLGWSHFILPAGTPQSAWDAHRWVRERTGGSYRGLGLEEGWRAYNRLTWAGMATGGAIAVTFVRWQGRRG